MLKKLPFIIAFAGAALVSATSAQALSVYFIEGSMGPDPLNGTHIIEDFEGFNDGDTYGDINAGQKVFSAGVGGFAAQPAFFASGNFLGVQNDESTIPANFVSQSISLPMTQVLSFVIGSLDTYNRVVLNFLSGASMTLNGAQIKDGGQADGNQVLGVTNGRVFYDTQGLDSIVGFELYSFGANAFEIDNISVAAPEPATWGMMILAAGMAGTALRRRRTGQAIA